MSLETPDDRAFRHTVRTWFHENLPPGWATPKFTPPQTESSLDQFLRDWQRKLYDGGWAGLTWPRKYGGRGATPIQHAIFLEERDRVKPPPDASFTGINLVGPLLISEGAEEQRQRYLHSILTGDEMWCQGFSEPSSGSDLASLVTRATLTNDAFIISGQKVWTSFAWMASHMILLARTDRDAPKHKGISLLIVPMDAPGVSVRAIPQINGRSDFAEVFLDDVRVPFENLVGALNRGWQLAMRILASERVGVTRTFETQRAFLDLLQACRAGTDANPPIDDPSVRDDLARLYCEVHAARCNYYRTIARQLRTGAPGPEESAGKLHTSELTQRIPDFALSILGADVLRGRRDSLGGPLVWSVEYTTALKNTIASGTSQVLRNVIGERVLGLPK